MTIRDSRLRYWSVAVSLTVFVPIAAASPLFAAESIGGAQRVVNEVHGFLGPVTRELEVEDEVFSEEVIETGDDGATRIVFVDGTELTMGPESRVTLDRFVYDPASGDGSMIVSFVSGIFEFASGLMPNDGYDLRTPFANLSIRGTVIRLRVRDQLQLIVPQGSVTLSDGTQTIELDNDQTCVVWQVEQGELRPLPGCSALLNDVVIMTAMLGEIEPGAGGPGPNTPPPLPNPIQFNIPSPNLTPQDIDTVPVTSPSSSQSFR